MFFFSIIQQLEKEKNSTTKTTTLKNNIEDKSSYSQKITISDIKKMNIDEVYELIRRDIIGIQEKEAIKLKKLNVDGSILLSFNEEILKEFFSLIGPIIQILNKLNEIKKNGI